MPHGTLQTNLSFSPSKLHTTERLELLKEVAKGVAGVKNQSNK